MNPLPEGVWAVIPVHNRCETTLRCLHHLETLETHRWLKVLVVDDGSTDGTAEAVRRDFPWAEILAGNGQLWWGGAIRLGMEEAARHKARGVIWLNDDTLPAAGSLEMLAGMALERNAICGGVCPTLDPGGYAYGGGTIQNGWPTSFKPMPGPEAAPLLADWLSGNMVAIPADVWRRAGFPEGRWIKHYFADVEYIWRAAGYGFSVFLVPAALGEADWNGGGSYYSWLDDRLSSRTIWAGFASPKMWWYAPGAACFQWRAFGFRGGLSFLALFPKAFIASVFKQLPTPVQQRIRGAAQNDTSPGQ